LCEISDCCKSLDFYVRKFNEISKIFQILKNSSKYIKVFLKIVCVSKLAMDDHHLTIGNITKLKGKKKTKENKSDPNPWIGKPYSLWQSE
jgi:hypothetical protein